MMIKIALGSDHAGFEMKNAIHSCLSSGDATYKIKDHGSFTGGTVDYPDVAHAVALAVGNGEFDYGVLFCGTANGMAITSNKHPTVRAAVCWSEEIATLARQHNDANILCIPGRFINITLTKKIVQTFLTTGFDGGRHKKRIQKISF